MLVKCRSPRDPRLQSLVRHLLSQAVIDMGEMHQHLVERGRRTWSLLCRLLEIPESSTIEQAEAAASVVFERRNR